MSEAWLWPTLEIFHFFGLCLLLGASIIFDLRMVGVARAVPIKLIEKFMAMAVWGFVINLITGILFVVGDPDRYMPNIAFRWKIVLIIVAGLNVAHYMWKIRPKVHSGQEDALLTGGGRFVAAFSLLLWTAIIILGRMIPYVEY